jgi:NAD(P)-dependent dehydrogenase (short-subunit alcohol dehydrogenase family)
LSSQKGIREAAKEFLSWSDIPTLNILVNSAGIMNIPERTLSEDGIEITYATNHLGHFLLTNLVMPKILKAAESNAKGATRIINVSSGSPTVARPRFSDINFETLNKNLPEDEKPPFEMLKGWGNKDPEDKAYVPIEAYNQSKVANVLFSVGLNKRLFESHGILSLSLHPGIIRTELSRDAAPEVTESINQMEASGKISFRTQGAGSSTSLTAATDPKLTLPLTKADDNGRENTGVFLMDCQIFDGTTHASTSGANAEKLWEISEGLVNEQFTW